MMKVTQYNNLMVNRQAIASSIFNGGECHVDISAVRVGDTNEVIAYLYSSDDIMRLLLVIDAIRQTEPLAKIYLTIPYFPYARQDRVCNRGEALSIHVMANLINGLAINQVTIIDPHSEVTPNLLNHCKVISQADILKNSVVADFIKKERVILVAPDKGARYKTETVAQAVGAEAVFCHKVRDPKRGEILETQIPEDVSGQKYLLIDDICDGGRTFIEIAKRFKQAGASALYLYVTHGIFAKGLACLKPYFDHIYCVNSFLKPTDIESKFLTIVEVNHES